MAYNYYIKVTSEEHMPFASELCKAYGIYSENNKLHNRFLIAYLDYYGYGHVENYIPLYYNTRYGLEQVFPSELYVSAINELLAILEEDSVTVVKVGNKNYKVLRRTC